VRKEVFKGSEVKGAHRSGSEGAIAAILGYAVAAYALFLTNTNAVTGSLLGECACTVMICLPSGADLWG
jgi:fatty acid desaturase (delta-4 desaturase)